MTPKISRRQMLKLMAVAAGGSGLAVLNRLLSRAQTAASTETYLPFTANGLPQPTPSPTTRAGTYTYVDGYGGDTTTAKDTLLNNVYPALGLGDHGSFQMDGGQIGLLFFDISAIPSYAVCTRAYLDLHHNYEPENGGTGTIYVYEITAANANWQEGVSRNPAPAGAACYLCKVADGAGGSTADWAGSPGLRTAGIDYINYVVGSASANAKAAMGTLVRIELDTATIQDWFGASNANNGILIVSDTYVGHYAASDFGTTGYRPVLTVEYIIG